MVVRVAPVNANACASTIAVNWLCVRYITGDGTGALVAGLLVTTKAVELVYNGTNFECADLSKVEFTQDGAFSTGAAFSSDTKTITHGLGTDDVEIFLAVDDPQVSNAAYCYAIDNGGYFSNEMHNTVYTGASGPKPTPISGDIALEFRSGSGGGWIGNYKVTVRRRN